MPLRIGGLTPLTTIDFPGRLAAVVFCQGCAWRCPYCHNPHLLPVASGGDDWPMLQRFLEARRGLLDGVVFSGGEPLFQSGLGDAMEGVKSMGFKVALHTAGTHPERLERLLPLLDWVGFDIKRPFETYPQLTKVAGSGLKAQQSLTLLLQSGIGHEVRTTVDPGLSSRDDLLGLARKLAALGVTRYVLQPCRPVGTAMQDDRAEGSSALLHDTVLLNQLERLFTHFMVRTA